MSGRAADLARALASHPVIRRTAESLIKQLAERARAHIVSTRETCTHPTRIAPAWSARTVTFICPHCLRLVVEPISRP